MASVLYYGPDPKAVQILTEFFKHRKEDAGEVHSIVHATDEKKFQEVLTAVPFDVALVEQATMTTAPEAWIDSFRKKFPSFKAPVLMVGEDQDIRKVQKILLAGFKDYLVMPADKPLVIEKVNMYSTGTRSKDLRQVYSLQMNQAVDIAKSGNIEELSEFDCKIKLPAAPVLDELISLYSNAFGPEFNETGATLARCVKVEPHPSTKDAFLGHFVFVGVSPAVLTNIRTALRKSYVAGKKN